MGKKELVKQFLKDAVISFFYWTLALTPYMVFIVKTDASQYIKWVGMQAILVPPLGALFLYLYERFDKKRNLK
ncbi:hypothetical protein FJZ53_02820 [Candidatus Woesearchaeota archaeon]|nr:hypothetical protein [Candidatus Woesearchaeota archaeon]